MPNLYDVVVCQMGTNKIVSIIGKDLIERLADRRVESGMSRIDLDNYYVDMLLAGSAKVGDIFPAHT